MSDRDKYSCRSQCLLGAEISQRGCHAVHHHMVGAELGQLGAGTVPRSHCGRKDSLRKLFILSDFGDHTSYFQVRKSIGFEDTIHLPAAAAKVRARRLFMVTDLIALEQ